MASAAELRALADQMEVMEGKERAVLEAKAAYSNGRTTKNAEALRDAYRVAVDELAYARMETRNNPISAVAVEPGSATIIPAAVSTAATGQGA